MKENFGNTSWILAFPFPFINHGSSRSNQSLSVFSHPFVINISVECTTHTTMLSSGGRSRQNLEENAISCNPDSQERINMYRRSPLNIFENLNTVIFKDLLFAISQTFASSIDLDGTSIYFNFMSTKVCLCYQLVARLKYNVKEELEYSYLENVFNK